LLEVRKLPLPIDVTPYTLNGVIGGDNYLTHYKASNDDGDAFVITEFYPAYMVKREDDGTLGISERFAKEFTNDRDDFIRRAEGFREVRDASLHPVVDVFEKNHTAYIVRRVCGLTSAEQYMGSATMDFDEAYFFVRPLIVSMAMAADKGMLFNITPADFRVNSYKQLVLCAPPSWDSDFHKPLVQIARLYYKLLTGTDAPEQGAPAFSAYGIEVPPRIESLIMEILGGDILYGSLDDFHKKFKSLIDGNIDTSADTGKRTLAAMRGTIAALFVMFSFSLILLVYGGVRAHRISTSWANPDNFATADALPPPLFDFSEITLTHPRNSADPLSGCFAVYGDFMFFRGERGMYSRLVGDITFIPGAVGMTALANDRLIVPNALPAHIVGHGRHVYFADMASDGAIYRAAVTGNDLTRITNNAALNLAVVGDSLFYSSVDDNHSLWRFDINNGIHHRITDGPIYAAVSAGSRLFYVKDTSLYAWNLEEETLAKIADDVLGRLRIFNGSETIYYLDTYRRIQNVTFDGRTVVTRSPRNVRTYDVFYQWILFTEEGRHVPRAYNMDTGNFYTLSSTDWVSYIWVHDGNIYGIDHRNPRIVHNICFP
jgi:hypothetical protein